MNERADRQTEVWLKEFPNRLRSGPRVPFRRNVAKSSRAVERSWQTRDYRPLLY
jgi:hypothetical protein